MKASRLAASIALLAFVLTVPQATTAQDKRAAQPTPASTTAAAPVYKPPLRGAPGGRVGGGTRGTGRETSFVLSVLAPDHTGLTASEQPSLYWFISRPTAFPVEISIVDPSATEPLLEAQLPPPIEPGVHRIRLADRGVRLAPGVSYRWFVAIVPDPDRRSKDILAGGAIERADLPETLRGQLAEADKAQIPSLYANAGYWYDALAAISERIDAAPTDAGLRAQRDALLTQVGLPEVRE